MTGSLASNQSISFNQFLNPIKILGGITKDLNPLGENTCDAMLVKVERRLRGGFSLINSFTWSKLYKDTPYVGPEIAGPVVEHKLGGEDRTFHLSIAPIFELRVGRGRKLWTAMPRALGVVLGGWELSGHYNIQSSVSVPFTATDSFFYDGKNIALPKGE